MKTPPQDLPGSMINAVLVEGWAIHPTDLRYMPVGFGSHHWGVETASGERWYVTVDDLHASHLNDGKGGAFAALETAFRTAAELRDGAGLDFVVGPHAGAQGTILQPLGERYALSVFPFLEVEPVDTGEYRSDVDRLDAMRLVGHVHNASDKVPVNTLRRENLIVQDRDRLMDALDALDRPWSGGPYAEPARTLLRDHAAIVRATLDRFDALAASVLEDQSDWVITHGEPHAANVVRTRRGDLVMVDWDTVAFGPRERDLWMLIGSAATDWTAYHDVTGVTSISGDAIRAYQLQWDLSEIAVFTGWFRAHHERTEDTAVAWTKLEESLRNLPDAPSR